MQGIRYCQDPAQEKHLERLLYHWMEFEFQSYFRGHLSDDLHLAEELFHDAYLELLQFLRRDRGNGAAPRFYIPFAYRLLKQKIWKAFGSRHPKPIGDLRELADTARPQFPGALWGIPDEPMSLYIPPTKSLEQYSEVVGSPISLSPRQLSVLRALASGDSHGEIADALAVPIRSVHDAIGNVETKVQQVLSNPSIRRSHLSYLPDISASNRVFILCNLDGKTQTVLGEGPIPFEEAELKIAGAWVKGESLDSLIRRRDLDSLDARKLYLRLIIERRRDFDELFEGRGQVFKATYELHLSESEGEYALLRALGLERVEIAAATGQNLLAIAARTDRIGNKLQALFHDQPSVRLIRPYYCMVGDSREQLRAVVSDASGHSYLIHLFIHSKFHRGRRIRNRLIEVGRAEAAKQIGFMEGQVRKVMTMRVLEGKSTQEVANLLGTRVDSVRKLMASGSYQLGIALGQPELNLYNLQLR
jgi:DNA-binding CsgD family transcriptional regulator